MTKKTLNYQLSEGEQFALPYPSISDLSYIFLEESESLIDKVYSWCSPEQQALFDDDFILLHDLTNAVLEFHYLVIMDKPRHEGFFDKVIREEEERALKLECRKARREALQKVENKKRQTSGSPPSSLMNAVLEYSQQSDKAVNFNAWLHGVAEYLTLSAVEVSNLPYDQFIEASNALTIRNDIQVCQEIDAEAERKKNESKQRQ